MSDRNIHIAQLLSSRLCHDLMGPAGAINAGLELVSDEGGGVPAAEAFALLGQSAEEITARLNFFRVAFGAAGGRRTSGDEIAVAELRQLAADMFKTSQADIQWRTPPGGLESVRLTRGKVLLNMVLMAVDTLPRGGDVAVQTAMVPQGFGLSVSARGRGGQGAR